MDERGGRLAVIFSCIGHFYFHYFAAMYFTIVLAMEADWDLSFSELIELWTPAALLIGVFALPAGRLADKWSAPGMMVVMFLGMGIATSASGFMNTPTTMMVMLAAIGLFGAIYHPVGISWLVRMSEENTGKKLAVNGVFGGLGAAAAGGATGLLIEAYGWREAFIIPGALCAATGIAMLWYMRAGVFRPVAAAGAARKSTTESRGNLKAFGLLLLPMFAVGLIYNTLQTAMPKLFEEGLIGMLGGDLSAIGALVAVVYTIGAFFQLVGGFLADRFPLKRVYVLCLMLQVPFIALIGMSGEVILFMAAVFVVALDTSALPAENMLLSKYAPDDHQGVAFGVKFVLSFGAAPLGVQLIAWVREATGSFELLFLGLCFVLLFGFLAALWLPSREEASQPIPAAAE